MAKNFRTLSEKVRANPERRARVEEHKRALNVALALAELRERRGITQQTLAGTLATSQANVSRIEHEEDVYVSTLSRYVTALGGHLVVAAAFSDQTIYLSGPTSPAFTGHRKMNAGTVITTSGLPTVAIPQGQEDLHRGPVTRTTTEISERRSEHDAPQLDPLALAA